MKIELTSVVLDAIASNKPRILAGQEGEQAGASASFTQSFKQAMARVDGQQHDAHERMAAVDSGESDDLVGAMLASQEAQLSFSMMMQVRNKLMSAFDDIIKMQV